MSSLREQIIQAALALLNTSPPSGVPQTTRARVQPYDPSELPAMTIKSLRNEGQNEKEGRWGYFIQNTFSLRMEFYVAGDAADELIDPMYVWAVQQLGAQQFGSLAQDCYEGIMEWEYADQDLPYAKATLDFRVEFNSLKKDPTTAG